VFERGVVRRVGDCREAGAKRTRLLSQELGIVICGQRLDGERFTVAQQQVDRAAPDGAGRPEDRHPPRRVASGQQPIVRANRRGYRHSNTLSPPIRVKSATTGTTASRPSSRSRRPPCPGMRPLESFTPNLRLATDSARSPNCSTIASPALISTRGSTAETPRSRAVAQPATAAQAAPPINPAQVFRGLQRGASRGPPKRRPIA